MTDGFEGFDALVELAAFLKDPLGACAILPEVLPADLLIEPVQLLFQPVEIKDAPAGFSPDLRVF